MGIMQYLSNSKNLTKSIEQILPNANMITLSPHPYGTGLENQGLYYIRRGSINYRRSDIK